MESAIGLTWATRIGALVLLAGVIYFFKYAVDRAWIGPWARVCVGLAGGAGLVAAAELLRRRVDPVWIQVVSGLGLAVALASVYAAHGLYQLVPVAVAFLAFAALAGAGAALAWRHSSPVLLAFALVAGLLDPLLMSTGVDQPLALFAWLLVLSAGVLFVAARRGWAWVGGLAILGALALSAGWYVEHYDLASGRYAAFAGRLVPTLAALCFSALYAAVAVLANARSRPLAAGLWAASALVLHGGLPALHPDAPSIVVALLAALAAAHAVGFTWGRRPDLSLITLGVGGLAQLALVAGTLSGPPSAPHLAVIGLWAAAHLAIAAAHALRSDEAAVPFVRPLLIAATLAFIALLVATTEDAERAARGGATLAALAAQAGLGSLFHVRGRPAAAATSLLLALGLAVLAAPFLFDGAPVTLAWCLLAAGTGLAAGRLRSRDLAIATLMLLALSVGRLVLFEVLRPEPEALTTRLRVVLIGAAISWLLTGVGLRGAPPRDTTRALSRAAIALGHAAILGWLVGEVWTHLGGDLRRPATTVLVATYAAALLAGGFALRHAFHRWLGLGLLTLALGKLLLADLWGFSVLARMIVLISVGALLLASGFLYARFSERIKRAILDDAPDEAPPPPAAG